MIFVLKLIQRIYYAKLYFRKILLLVLTLSSVNIKNECK